MHDEHPHPLLAQVPLTVSPFLSLPTSVPLPYSYKSLPSTLPPSILSPQNHTNPQNAAQPDHPSHHQAQQQTPYILSSTGSTASTPDQILTSCIALQKHLQQLEADARTTLGAWEERRKKEDLDEKRRVAPGWLDNDVHILKPEVVDGGGSGGAQVGAGGGGAGAGMERKGEVPQLMDEDPQAEMKAKEGEELDRVFGGLKV